MKITLSLVPPSGIPIELETQRSGKRIALEV